MQIKDNENKLGIFLCFWFDPSYHCLRPRPGNIRGFSDKKYWTVHVKDKLIPFNFTFLYYFRDFFQLCWLEVSKSFKTMNHKLYRIYARGENKSLLLLIQFPPVPSNNFEPIWLYHLLFVPKIRTTRDPDSAVGG